MQRIEPDNFRVFGSPAGFDLAPVTVLTGKNNSGKSSLIKAFLVLADYLEQDDQTVLRLDGPRASRHRISSFNDLRNWENPSNVVALTYQIQGIIFSFSFVEKQTGDPIWLSEFAIGSVHSDGKLQLTQFTDEERGLLNMEKPDQAFRLHLDQSMLDTLLGPLAPWLAQSVELRSDAERWQREFTEQEARFTMAEGLLKQFPVLNTALIAAEYDNEKASLQQLREKAQQAAAAAAAHERPAPDTVYRGVIYLSDFHRRRRKLPELIGQGLGRGFVEASALTEPSQPMLQVKDQLVRHVERELFDLLTIPIHHLGANRMHQARLYMMGEKKSEINAIAEDYLRLDASGGTKNRFLQHWVTRFELGNNARIQVHANTAINIVVQRKNKKVNLVDIGFGAGQLLTILFQIATLIELRAQVGELSARPIVLIEEPEANLHPQLQSLLAEMFTEAAQEYGFRFILETHSEYLIRNIQVLVKERQVKDLFRVYYFDMSGEANGNRHGHEMRLREDGVFMDEFGEGFLMNESASLTFKLF